MWASKRACSACIRAEQWGRFEMTDEKRRALPAALVEVATEIFYAQVENWLALGGLEYAGRVEPMGGIDLNHLRKIWSLGEEKWQSFWNGYVELIGVNGPQVIPPEPNHRKRASARFHRYPVNHGLTPLVRFLFLTPAPDTANAELFRHWRKILWTASKRVPDVYARTLAAADAGTKARIAALMSSDTPVA